MSKFLQYRWYEPVYYLDVGSRFPTQSNEKPGRFVGFADHCGDALTYLVLPDDTQQVISRSVLRSALNSADVNERANSPPDGGESGELDQSDEEKGKTTLPIVSTSDLVAPGVDSSEVELPKFAPDELIGRTFLRDTPDGQRVCAQEGQRFRVSQPQEPQILAETW